jgi:hypothetical protein
MPTERAPWMVAWQRQPGAARRRVGRINRATRRFRTDRENILLYPATLFDQARYLVTDRVVRCGDSP